MIKSEVKKEQEKPFPKLMIAPSDDMIVLMADPIGSGTIIDVGRSDWERDEVGTYLDGYTRSWDMDDFVDFNGLVTLSNEQLNNE